MESIPQNLRSGGGEIGMELREEKKNLWIKLSRKEQELLAKELENIQGGGEIVTTLSAALTDIQKHEGS